MSKFDYEHFYHEKLDRYVLGVSREKYGFMEALELAKRELKESFSITAITGFVRYRFGADEYGENRTGWWIEDRELPRSCPCWIFIPEYKGKRR